MSGSDVEHVSSLVDGDSPQSRRLSSSSTTECFFDALSNGSHDPPLTRPSHPPISSRSGTTHTTQPGVSGPQPLALPATVVPDGYPTRHHRSSPDPDEYYRPHPSTSFAKDDTGIRAGTGSSSRTSNTVSEARSVYTSQRLSSIDRVQDRSPSDTSKRAGTEYPSGASFTSFKDLINKFNSNPDKEQSRASSPVDYNTGPSAAPRRRETDGSTSQSQQAYRWNLKGDPAQGPPSPIAPPFLNTAGLDNGSLDDLQPPNLLPRRRLFGELLTVDTGFQGSEGSIPSPNPAFFDQSDPTSNLTPLTPTACTGEQSNRHRRTRSDIPGNSPLGSRTSLDSPHSKSRIPISSHRLISPTASDRSSPSPKAESPVGVSRLPKPSPRSPRDLATHGQSTLLKTTTTTTARGRREMGYGRSRTAAPPPKKSPPLRSSRPRQPISHTASSAARSRVGETVSNLQKQINREREPRNSRLRDRRLPELGNVDFATRRQKIQQAFNRTVKENERRKEEAAELRRRAHAQEPSVKRDDSRPPESELSENKSAALESSAQPDDAPTIIEENLEPCADETPVKGDTQPVPQLHVNTNVPIEDMRAITMDSPTLGHPSLALEEGRGSKPSNMAPASSAASCSEESPVTAFDPEPQTEISRKDVHTSHRTLLSEIMRIRESSPSSSSCDEKEYDFSDNDDKGSIPVVLNDNLGNDNMLHRNESQEVPDPYTQRAEASGVSSNRWSLSSWSSSLPNRLSTDDQCEGSGDDLSQLRQSTEDSELVTRSCSASSSTPSDTGKEASGSLVQTTGVVHEPKQEDIPSRKPYGHSKTPSLAKLGGWDSKRITQLYLEELARGGDRNLPLDVRSSPEPRFSISDSRADGGGTDSLTEDPVLVSRPDGIPGSARHSHTASLVLRDDWEHASPSIMDWMQVAADDASAPQDSAPDTSPQNDGVPTPRLVTSNPPVAYTEDGSAGLGLAINIQSPQESGQQERCPPPMPLHEPPAPPVEAETGLSVVREPLDRSSSVQPIQQPSNNAVAAIFAPLGPVHSTGSSEDSLRRHEPSPSPQARDSSATSLVPSSLEQHRTDTSSPTPDQRRLKKRRHVIKELVDTEYTFGRDMKVVDDIYKGTSSSCLDLSPEDVKTLFANSDQIVQFSMTFQDALKEAAKSVYVMPKSQRWSSKRSGRSHHAHKNDSESQEGVGPSELEKDRATSVGRAFITHIPYMEKVYAEYLKNHDAANKKLQTLQRSPNVTIWLNECREWASDLTTAWDLDSLLVKPVQRILKYPLLISELLDSTPSDHPDHSSLAKALDEVTNISVRINELKRRADLVGQVVGRKRKESDVRMGLSKAFGRRTEKLRQQVGLSDMVADKVYDALSQRFGDNFFQLQVVMRDAEMYTRETQSSMDRFLEFVTAIEAFIDVFQTSYPELEGKWRVFKISVQDIMAVTLPEHLDVVRKSVIDPMVTLLKLHDGPQRVMKKRDKRLMDYARFKSITARGDKPDKKTVEQADQFVALNETLKDELPKLYSLTAKLMEACLKNFVQIQTTWYIVLQKKIGPLIDSFPENVQRVIDDWTTRFNFSEAQVLSLGICNGSLLADTVNLVNFNTPPTAPGVSSPRRPSTVHSSSTRTMEESPKVSHDFSTGKNSFQSSSVDGQSQISYGRHRADSAFSGRQGPEPSELPRSQVPQQVTGASTAPVPTSSHSHNEPFPRLPTLTLDSPFLTDVIQSSNDGNTADEAHPTSPAGRYSGFFSSAMPMSDNPQEIPDSDPSPTKEPTVLFLAASIYEFNIDRARREAGYPYLTYVAGEIFDVIAEKGELWLARNQDDPTHQVAAGTTLGHPARRDDFTLGFLLSSLQIFLVSPRFRSVSLYRATSRLVVRSPAALHSFGRTISTPRSSTPRFRTKMRDGGLGKLHRRMRRFGDTLNPDDAYLSLTRGDLQSLKDDWLTDNIISFWEEYLERESLVQYKTSNIVLLRPSMSFMILQTPNPHSLRDALPDFTRTTHVFLPINDCRNVSEAEGGTHWSLLLISIVDGIAFHYDSLPPGNYWEARTVTMKFGALLNRPIRFINLEDSPVQENGSDCGVFVCLSMRHLLLKRLLKANSNEKISMSLGGWKVDARSGRKEIAKIIEGFRKEGERRRSVSVSPSGSGKKSKTPPRIE
ncbi:putative Rho guanyl nucleotide exchange factor [Aspergillus lucknowensis]|uniref:Dynamin-binding protein n=1 Tax=Aspergillus lucknowensis TaxID=176173 RepID=A0ABR4LB55_9EURO